MEEKRFYSRKSPRMPHYDYSTENYYFVTICTHEKRCIFGLPEEKTYLGKLAAQHIREIETHYSFVAKIFSRSRNQKPKAV